MEKRTKNKKRPGSFSSKEIYLLSSLLVCKHCNGLYYGNKRTKRNKYNTYYYYKYVCHNKNKLNNCNAPELNQFEIESLVIKELEKVLLNSNNIDKIVDKINEKYSELYNTANTDIVDTEKEIKEVQCKINNLMRLVSDGLYNDDIKQNLESLETDKTKLKVKLNMLKNISKNKILNKDDIIKAIKLDINIFKSNDKIVIKNLLGKYINKIIVDYPNIEIYFKFNADIDKSNTIIEKSQRQNSLAYLTPQERRLTNMRTRICISFEIKCLLIKVE